MTRFSFIFLSLLFFLFSCKKSEKTSDDFSSSQDLFIEYISSYTQGFISSDSEIRVKLSRAVETAVPGEEVDLDLFSFSPKIKGNAYWEDNRTLVFRPDKRLDSGTEYKAEFMLSKLVETPEEKGKFRFVFQCIPQNYEVKITGLSLYSESDLERVKIIGTIQVADQVEGGKLSNLLKASQNKESLEISIEQDAGGNLYPFSIENVKRGERRGKVDISWDGESIGVEKDGEMEYEIPALSEYTISAVQIIRAEENYVSVLFSDPIDQRQNIRGLVQFSKGNNPRVVVELNELKIYPTSRVSGEIQLTINKNLKNTAGYGLAEDFKTSLQFSQIKPEVRLATNKGVIMPSSEGLIFPFEAVSLRAVDLTIIRIFEDNVLQYLQTIDLGSEYEGEIRRVGRPVLRKTIPLNTSGMADLDNWNRYTLDLSEYINVEPGAIYQIRLNFRKSQSLYFCESTEDPYESIEDYDEDLSEDWDDDEYYYYYYDWEHRDDPCHTAYYAHNRREQKKLILGSDLGLIAKSADQGELVTFVTNLISASPVAGAEVEVYDYQQQLLGKGKTDADGKFVMNPDHKPYFMVAKAGNQFGYLKLDDGSANSLSNFNVSGSKIQKGLKGYLYGERGVWRPGDTLHLSFIMEDIEERLPEGHPVILKLFNPMGQLFRRMVQTSSTKDLYQFEVNTPSDAPTGNWRAEVSLGGAKFSKTLKIETVKPNRLKINLDFGKERLLPEAFQSAQLSARWLHGAVARNLKASYEVLLVPVKTTFKGYETLIFDDPNKKYTSRPEEVFNARLDSEGKADISFKLESNDDAPGMLNAVFRGKVFEQGGDFSIDKTTIPYVPYSSFAGMQMPDGDRWGRIPRNEVHNVRLVSVDSEGNPVSRNLEVKLYKLRWRWWWDNSYENSNYTSRYYSEHLATEQVRTLNGEGKYGLLINQGWGRYYLQVTDLSSGHSTGRIFYTSWSSDDDIGEIGGVTMLDFGVDKESASVGEKVQIDIPSSAGGKALVSLETGSSVLQTFWVETSEENTRIEFEATKPMAPNIYAHISLLQPHGQTSNDLPVRMYGVRSIQVNDPDTELKPEISMPDELAPGDRFKVKVKEASGKPMAYTIAIVEEGLLDLTKFKTPDPHQSFYAREALGVKTWDIFDEVMGSYGGRIEKLLAVGGDGEVELPEENEANRFKPVVLFKGPYYLEAGKTGEYEFEMPQYIGSVRAMVVAGYQGRYGSIDKTVPVKQPLMVLATLPRVAGPTEEIVLPVNIFTADDKLKQVMVEVKPEGKLAVVGSSTQNVGFQKSGDKVVFFKLKASEALGVGKVNVKATSGGITANYEVELQIRPSNPEMTHVKEKILTGNDQMNYEPLGIAGTNESVIEISSLPPLNLEQRLKYLIHFPHGCVEQTTSSVFAQLYLDELVDLDESRQETIQKNINAAIDRLRSFQLPSGAFAYWPGNSEPNYWGTNYAGHFLLEAERQGYLVPEDMLSKWKKFQRKEAKNWTKGTYNDYLTQTYRLYTLSLAGSPALGAMNRMKENTSMSVRAKWSLASAYATSGYKDAANEIIDGLTTDIEDYREMGRTYGSTQRDQAIILGTLVKLNRQTDAFVMIQKIAEAMGDSNRWMSTQTTAYCLMNISEFAKTFPPGEDVNVSVVVSGNTFRLDGTKYMNQITLIEPDQKADIQLENRGSNPLYVRLVRTGVPIEGGEVPTESNLKMQVSYKSMQGVPLDVSNLPQGTDFMAEVKVTNPGLRGNYEELALTQIFPAGWEIINTRLDDVDLFYEEDVPEYKDIRDDRVLTYFDLPRNRSVTYRVLLNASYQGRYYLPSVSAEAMYDNSISANTEGRWVNVRIQE